MNLLAAEWIKVRSVRSTLWTLLATIGLAVGLSAFVAANFRANIERVQNFDPIVTSLYGLTLAQLALVVFGVLTVGSEYASGSIRPTLAAVPRRGRFYAAKTAVIGLVALAVSAPSVLAAFVVGQHALGPYAVAAGDPDTVPALLGATAYLPLICLFAAGVATMVRSSAIALGVLVPVLFLGSQGLGNVPGLRPVLQYLPDQAGMELMRIAGGPDSRFGPAYGPGVALVILVGWTVAALVGGFLVLRRRDA
ncbi:MAG: ABC transporter permease [Hamadaea sp.]|uniref:ABC transporter permease n=1 Tax=Hamadaea sp. TaxID=2024425 RepID=UPI0018117AEC|nr:ABC transporter permease [Hamadaea sp.]NUR71781.1 ABC transporter permease [Hamadaea sp.]NUT19095.1 ABC transporter permease [Hamadaea sp.]